MSLSSPPRVWCIQKQCSERDSPPPPPPPLDLLGGYTQQQGRGGGCWDRPIRTVPILPAGFPLVKLIRRKETDPGEGGLLGKVCQILFINHWAEGMH